MAVNAKGHVFFSDSFGKLDETRRIYELAPPYTGEPQATQLVFELPAGLFFEGESLFVCDVKAKKVVRLDASHQVQSTWSDVAAWNVARVGKALVAVTTAGSVVELQPDGGHTVLFEGAAAPFGLAAAKEGALWLSEQGAKPGDPGRLTARRTDGSVARTIDYDWKNPEGLATGPDGRLWVAETERGELLAIDGEGSVEVMHTAPFPIVASVGPDGSLFVTTKNELLRVALEK